MRTILKFDTGADGFKKMMYVLAACALLIVIVGIYFLMTLQQDVRLME